MKYESRLAILAELGSPVYNTHSKSLSAARSNKMVEIAELTSQDTLKLPTGVAARFRPLDHFVVWVEGDTLTFKRITPPAVTDIVEQAPEGEALSLEEINEIVHRVRSQGRMR